MLNKENIYQATKKAIKSMPYSQEALAKKIGMRAPHFSTKLKSSDQITQLLFLQELADAMEIDIEQLVLPGLTEADKYINYSNFNQRGAKHSNVLEFAREPHQRSSPIITKSLDLELQQKLYESQESRISLLEQISSLKDEINALKIELNNCKST
ncbi:hypothetical protein [Catalinimonas niigatensis]|uniref:hypothetical protein n=1 Tax=Catalinimonas niigatensis TaxID=1397264 RepID=UPI00266700F5|nr:hypothetical protein [Catalinimonas niigatensis]WPP53574.1 hypothetical protein PZB72_14470 [Catalinimonas niigatensis]